MDVKKFAQEWVEAWNAHDLDRVLSHFSEDVEISSPMIKIATGGTAECLHGKIAVRSYWETGLKKFPDLHFELVCATEGINSVALYYKTVMDKMAIEVMFFNEQALVHKVNAYYSQVGS